MQVITDGKTYIGAMKLPERKRPCIAVTKGNTTSVYGSFINEQAADEFINELSKFCKGGRWSD